MRNRFVHSVAQDEHGPRDTFFTVLDGEAADCWACGAVHTNAVLFIRLAASKHKLQKSVCGEGQAEEQRCINGKLQRLGIYVQGARVQHFEENLHFWLPKSMGQMPHYILSLPAALDVLNLPREPSTSAMST